MHLLRRGGLADKHETAIPARELGSGAFRLLHSLHNHDIWALLFDFQHIAGLKWGHRAVHSINLC